jgi:hypothetical protein
MGWAGGWVAGTRTAQRSWRAAGRGVQAAGPTGLGRSGRTAQPPSALVSETLVWLCLARSCFVFLARARVRAGRSTHGLARQRQLGHDGVVERRLAKGSQALDEGEACDSKEP